MARWFILLGFIFYHQNGYAIEFGTEQKGVAVGAYLVHYTLYNQIQSRFNAKNTTALLWSTLLTGIISVAYDSVVNKSITPSNQAATGMGFGLSFSIGFVLDEIQHEDEARTYRKRYRRWVGEDENGERVYDTIYQ